jgi:hypothetical protein
MSKPERTITIAAPYYDEHDAILTLETADGEIGSMTLSVDDCTLASGEGFRPASFGPSLLEMSDNALAGMFGSFLAHALESSEDGAQDGWTYLSDDAQAWADELTLMGEAE